MTETAWTVTGMTCQHCVSSVTEEVSEVPGVAGVDVTLEGGRMVVRTDGPADEAAVGAAVAEAGYVAEPVPA